MACVKEKSRKDKADEANQKAFDKRMEIADKLSDARIKKEDGYLEAGEGVIGLNPAKVVRGAKNAAEAKKKQDKAQKQYDQSESDEVKSADELVKAERELQKCIEKEKNEQRRPRPDYRLTLELEFDITDGAPGEYQTISQGHVVFTPIDLKGALNSVNNEYFFVATGSDATVAGSFRAILPPATLGSPTPAGGNLGYRVVHSDPYDCTEQWEGTFKWQVSASLKDRPHRLMQMSGYDSAMQLKSNRNCRAIRDYPREEFESQLRRALSEAADAGLMLVSLPEQGLNTQIVNLKGVRWTIRVDKL
jgi:hypothetical protein